MSGFATLAMLNLDCADPEPLATFWSAVLGWPVVHRDDDYAMLSDGTSTLGFGRIEGYQAPQWPQEPAPKRYHLDLYVDDLDAAEARCLNLGATKPAQQPQPDRWRVLLDPAGQPFDLCVKSS